MSENTKIEWADHTFNPWVGCTKVSPACDHCYAESWAKRSGSVQWGGERRRTTPANWRQPLKWNAQAKAEGRRYRVFCASLADVFDNEVPLQWRVDLFDLIRNTPDLDWLLLTKRIGNAAGMMRQAWGVLTVGAGVYEPLPNIWLGATVVNQTEANRDIPKLLAVPARVRFLSIEPMLGPIDLEQPHPGPDLDQGGGRMICQPWLIQSGIDWFICGGESGPGARPMHPDWARSLRDQCADAGMPFLFKQWGEWQPINQQSEAFTNSLYASNRKASHHEDQGAIDELYGRRCTVEQTVQHLDGSVHHFLEPNAFPLGAMTMYRVGKKASGRLLDGVEHNGYPETACAT